MNAIWVLWPPETDLQWLRQFFEREDTARAVLASRRAFGVVSTLTRETFITPAHAAVLEAVARMVDAQEKLDAYYQSDEDNPRTERAVGDEYSRWENAVHEAYKVLRAEEGRC